MQSCATKYLTRSVTAVGAAAMSTALILPVATSLAEPRVTLREANAKVAELQHRAEVAAEKYNTARVHGEHVQRRLQVLRARVQDRRGDVSALEEDLGRMAAATYRAGGISGELTLLFSVDDPRELLRAATAVQQVSRQQAALLRSTDRARRELAADQRQFVAQEARRAEISATLAAQKAEVEKQLSKAQQVLDTLEAEQRARLEAQRRAAVRAAREAREAREAQQARASRSTRPATETNTSTGSGGGSSSAAETAVDFAYAQLGEPYAWGGAGPDSWDCSGLTMGAWAAAGVSLPHSSSMQYSSGTKVSRSALQPGDLVFYYSPISHVAIYVGNGQIIHAPNSSEPVKKDPIGLMPYIGAVRP